MKTISKLVVAAFAATALIPAAAMAQGNGIRDLGYLVNSNSGVVMNGYGQCWSTGDVDQPAVYGPCNPQPVAVAAPATVVVDTAPMAVVPEPAPAPVVRQFSLSGDALFAFDKAVLKPEGRTMLDGLIGQLAGTTHDAITVTGHTDRIGTSKYNQKLSERRAQAVTDYLAGKNVQADRIDAQGVGESQPVTTADACKGPTSAKVIACLQPDRRVDVHVTGTSIASSTR